jgi:hypothetical protein
MGQSNGFDLGEYAIKAAHAQFKAKQVIPSSPEAAQLGKYGNVPVSLFTGTPKISVPIFDRKSKIAFSVSMSYSAGGFKPIDMATWVGLGWSLNAGGVITRSAMGNPDMPANYFNQAPISLPAQNELFANYDIVSDLRKGNLEAQADMYYFNFGSYSGKFMIRQDQSIVKKSKDNLKINHCITCLPGNSWFTITDEQGIVYEFRDVELTTTVSDPADAPADAPPTYSTYDFASSWYLTKITSADGLETIEFEYYSTGQHTIVGNNFQNQSITYSRRTTIANVAAECPDNNGALTNSISNALAPLTKVSKKYIKRINFLKSGLLASYIDFNSVADTRLDFEDLYFPGERLLTGITIYNRDGFGNSFKAGTDYQLFYGYFSDPSNNVAYAKRLRLDSLRENSIDVNSTRKPAHIFTYQSIPPTSFNLTNIDHWGYANGAQNSSLVPNITLSPGETYGLGANREPNSEEAKAGILSRITYPTGGFTVFDYEGNQAKDNSGNVINIGGLRIKSISDYAAENQKATVKVYSYTLEDGTTSGHAVEPNYLSTSSYRKYPEACYLYGQDGQFNSACCEIGGDYQLDNFTISANSVMALGSIQGSYIGYSRVTEQSVDLNSANPLGKSVYTYHTESFQANDDHIGNGDLEIMQVYDNGSKLLSEVTSQYVYASSGSMANYLPSILNSQDSRFILCKYIENGTTYYEWRNNTFNYPIPCQDSRVIKTRFSIGGYVVSSQEKYLVQQTQKYYDQKTNTYISSVKKFTYGNPAHMLPTKIEQTANGPEVVVNEVKYPLDYSIPGGVTLDLPTQGIKQLKDLNIIAAEIENVQYRQDSSGTNRRYINGSLTLYESWLPNPTKLLRLEMTGPLASLTMSSTNGTLSYNSSYKVFGSFQYDGSGNLVEQAKTMDIPKSYVWDHNGTLPTAEVNNATKDMIAYTSFESDEAGNFSSISNLSTSRSSGGFTGVNGYTLTGNTISKTGLPAGRNYIISYWSKNGAQSVSSNGSVATRNVSQTHLGWTYFEHLISGGTTVSINGSGIIDELRLFPADAEMATYAYTSFDGIMKSSVTPSNAKNGFEYDGYSRLLNIRDEDDNIIKNYAYYYGTGDLPATAPQTLFYNQPAQGQYYSSTCINGSESLPVTYYVPYGKYAAVTQTDANNLATTDVQNNGQQYANENGVCVYWNTAQSKVFYKDNCTYEQGPPSCTQGVTYTVPAHTVYAADLATANQLAMDIADANGQAYANANCSCSCSQEGHKFINGTCETGTKYDTGYDYVPNCKPGWNYRCYYYYVFSDGSVSQTYSVCSRFPCVPQ